MDENTKQILEIVTNIQEQMVTKDDIKNLEIKMERSLQKK